MLLLTGVHRLNLKQSMQNNIQFTDQRLVISGGQDFVNTESLAAEGTALINQWLQAGNTPNRLEIDLSQLEHSNSGMISILLQWKQLLAEHSIELELHNPPLRIQRLITLYHLQAHFPLAS